MQINNQLFKIGNETSNGKRDKLNRFVEKKLSGFRLRVWIWTDQNPGKFAPISVLHCGKATEQLRKVNRRHMLLHLVINIITNVYESV